MFSPTRFGHPPIPSLVICQTRQEDHERPVSSLSPSEPSSDLPEAGQSPWPQGQYGLQSETDIPFLSGTSDQAPSSFGTTQYGVPGYGTSQYGDPG